MSKQPKTSADEPEDAAQEKEEDEDEDEDPPASSERGAPAEAAAPAAPPISRREWLERRWNTFFYAESDGTSVGIFRLLLGSLAVWQAFGIWLNLRRFWAADGMIPWKLVETDKFIWLTPFAWAPESETVLVGQAVIFTIAATGLLLGVRANLCAALVAYLHASFQYRNPFILNSGDRLFMIASAFAVLMPLARRFSVESWWRARANLAPKPAFVWGQRLLGMQIGYVYLNSAVAKLGNTRWRTGMALRDVLASPVFAEWPRYVDFKPIVWGLTYSTLLLELSFPVLIWFRRYRPFLLLWGVAFHVGIDVTMVIPIFSSIMIVSYVTYLSDDESRRALAWLARRLGRGTASAPA